MLGALLALLLTTGHHSARAQEKIPEAVSRRLGCALTLVTKEVTRPVFLTSAGGRSVFIVEKDGLLRELTVLAAGSEVRTVLDLRSLVSHGGEQGLLSAVFHPRFSENGRLFVNYTDRAGDTVVAEYRAVRPRSAGAAASSGASDESAITIDPGSARTILTIDQPYTNHNGGQLQFGPDGLLYIGTGDGGGAGDPHGNGQRLDSYLGKILRIDVDHGVPYAVPRDNPFAGSTRALPEVWAYGLRNPWRFSFDLPTGRLFVADVGQNRFEEIDLVERGGNYGWNREEGSHCFAEPCDSQKKLVRPIAEYGRDEGVSVTGGYVYRGRLLPGLRGAYVFGDFGSGRIWALREQSDGRWKREALFDSGLLLSSFGVDRDGELYALDLNGAVYKFSPII